MLGHCCHLWGGVGTSLWLFIGAGGCGGLLLVLVGYSGGSLPLVMSLHCCVGLLGCHGCLWMLVGMAGHCGVWMAASGSEYVGRDGGAHQ